MNRVIKKPVESTLGMIFTVILPLIFITETGQCNPEWIVEEKASTTANLRSTDLVLNSEDKPNVVFIAGNNLILAAKESDSTWSLDTLIENSASSVSIDLLSTDAPVILYSEMSTPSEMRYLYFDGSSWNSETIDEIWDAHEACLTINNRDIPTILYSQFVYLNPSVANTDLFFCERQATEWEYDSILSFNSIAEGTVSNLDLDLNSLTDEPIVLYRLFTDSTFTLEYSWLEQEQDSLNWPSLTLSQDPEHENSLDVDPNGISHCCYSSNSQLCYAFGDETGFALEIVDTEDSVAMYNDVQGDNMSIPSIVYNSAAGLKYATKTESGWEFSIIGPLYSNVLDPTIYLDSSGKPHVTWIDTGTQKVMYAYYSEHFDGEAL